LSQENGLIIDYVLGLSLQITIICSRLVAFIRGQATFGSSESRKKNADEGTPRNYKHAHLLLSSNPGAFY
jgi:hypothetical protein